MPALTAITVYPGVTEDKGVKVEMPTIRVVCDVGARDQQALPYELVHFA